MKAEGTIAEVLSGEARWCVAHSDALSMLRSLPGACADSLVTDPPAGIGFMGREWDKDKGGRDAWIAWLAEIMREALRVLKPGAHGFVWALPRTSHWTAMAIENAGFEIRDVFTHLFGSGFPKSLDVVKAIEDAGGPYPAASAQPYEDAEWARENRDGFGTAAKPASEHWILVRKPLDGTVAANVLAHGTGALNIDGCRIGTSERAPGFLGSEGAESRAIYGRGIANVNPTDGLGRWPANVILSHLPECREVGMRRVRASWPSTSTSSATTANAYGKFSKRSQVAHGDADGTETVPAYECADGCPVAMLDAQSGERPSTLTGRADPSAAHAHPADPTRERGSVFGNARAGGAVYADTGGASRFFYCAKPSTAEREAGCESLPKKSAGELTGREDGAAGTKSPRAGAGRASSGRANTHPTVKSIALMRWLCRLVTPPGGVVVDAFAGSGTTAGAAMMEQFRFIGAEMEADHVAIARARATYWSAESRQLDMFAALERHAS